MNANTTIWAGSHALLGFTMRLSSGEHLSRAQAAEFLRALLDPDAADHQVADALIAMSKKGETVSELTGMAEAMRDLAIPLNSPHTHFIDTAGTGAGGTKTFNVSTAAALVIAGAGLPVAKHGSRAVTSRCGSADVLEALGVKTTASIETTERCLDEHGICFMFAPQFHRATSRVAQVRRQLGIQTIFNLLGPLTNPARAPFQVLGVSQSSLIEPLATALSFLGVKNAWVVHGSDGLDEITLNGETLVAACAATTNEVPNIRRFTIVPSDFGIDARPLDELRAGDPQENAEMIRAILEDRDGDGINTARDLAILNAAAALHVAGVAPDLRTAADLARQSIESGRALSKLGALIRETNRSQ